MVNSIFRVLTDTISNRVSEVCNNIASSNKKYKELSAMVIEVEGKIIDRLPDKSCYLMNDYSDIKGERDALIQEQIYRQGLFDGMRINNVSNFLSGRDEKVFKKVFIRNLK